MPLPASREPHPGSREVEPDQKRHITAQEFAEVAKLSQSRSTGGKTWQQRVFTDSAAQRLRDITNHRLARAREQAELRVAQRLNDTERIAALTASIREHERAVEEARARSVSSIRVALRTVFRVTPRSQRQPCIHRGARSRSSHSGRRRRQVSTRSCARSGDSPPGEPPPAGDLAGWHPRGVAR